MVQPVPLHTIIHTYKQHVALHTIFPHVSNLRTHSEAEFPMYFIFRGNHFHLHVVLIRSQFSFQSQRKAMPKNAQTTTQLYSSYMLAKCSKFSNSTWTVNFQMFKLDLEKAEESEIKLPTLLDHWKSKRVPEKHLLYWLCQSLWLCGPQKTLGNS